MKSKEAIEKRYLLAVKKYEQVKNISGVNEIWQRGLCNELLSIVQLLEWVLSDED